jgi:nucleotide-binding universal stress UspA family protein
MFSKILVATDGSKTATAAVGHAAELARLAASPEVVIIHLCPGCTIDVDTEGLNRELAQKVLDEAAAAFKETKASVKTVLEVDYPPESLGAAIVEIAASENADLIVLGSRGLSEFKGMLLGSVSSKVVQHAHCPVLIVKNKNGD